MPFWSALSSCQKEYISCNNSTARFLFLETNYLLVCIFLPSLAESPSRWRISQTFRPVIRRVPLKYRVPFSILLTWVFSNQRPRIALSSITHLFQPKINGPPLNIVQITARDVCFSSFHAFIEKIATLFMNLVQYAIRSVSAVTVYSNKAELTRGLQHLTCVPFDL